MEAEATAAARAPSRPLAFEHDQNLEATDVQFATKTTPMLKIRFCAWICIRMNQRAARARTQSVGNQPLLYIVCTDTCATEHLYTHLALASPATSRDPIMRLLKQLALAQVLQRTRLSVERTSWLCLLDGKPCCNFGAQPLRRKHPYSPHALQPAGHNVVIKGI